MAELKWKIARKFALQGFSASTPRKFGVCMAVAFAAMLARGGVTALSSESSVGK